MRKFIFWTAVVLVSTIFGGLTYVFLSSSYGNQLQAQLETNSAQSIVVAANDIPQRRTIIESDLTMREVPLAAMPEGAASSFDEVVGMMATENVVAGEIVLSQQLALTGVILQEIALTIPENKVLVPIPLQSKLISTGLVNPGDQVDLFGTFVADEAIKERLAQASPVISSVRNAHETIAVLQNLEVHAIIIERTVSEMNTEDEDGIFVASQEGEQSILVALEPQDSVVVKYLLDTTGLLDIALRSPGDNQLADVTNVDLFYLADRYGIELVRGDPSSMTEELFQANPTEYVLTGTGPSPEFLDAIGEK